MYFVYLQVHRHQLQEAKIVLCRLLSWLHPVEESSLKIDGELESCVKSDIDPDSSSDYTVVATAVHFTLCSDHLEKYYNVFR